MLENEDFNQKKIDRNSEEVQNERIEEANSKRFLPLKEVVLLLNKMQSIEEVAIQLDLRVNVLRAKLKNAAIKNIDTGEWIYVGGNESKSLSRNVYSKIFAKPYDHVFNELDDKDLEYEVANHLNYLELYKDSLLVKDPIDKKSILFEAGLYNELRLLSQNSSIKMNKLVNVLVKKGLEYYRISECEGN